MALEIEKKARAAGLAIEKAGLAPDRVPVLRVAAVLDASGSMSSSYADGTVQDAFDQLLGAGLRLDDNGEIDTWLFDTSAEKVDTATPDDYGVFIKTKGRAVFGSMGGGTAYAPAIHRVIDDMLNPETMAENAARANGSDAPVKKKGFLSKLFGGGAPVPVRTTAVPTAAKSDDAEFANEPVLAFFVTDGENGDPQQTMTALRESGRYPIFWIMIGLGNHPFTTLKTAATAHDFVDFVQLDSLKQSDDAMYGAIFTPKFARWASRYPPATKKGALATATV